MKKIYKELTRDQVKRGVIFSSSLSVDRKEGELIHEVLDTEDNKATKIKRLLDDSFFDASHFKYNIIRQEVL